MDTKTAGKNNRELAEYILKLFARLEADKQRGESDRLLSCALVQWRTRDRNTPVPERKIYDNATKDALKTTCHGIAGYLLSPSIRWFRFTTKGKHFEKSDTLYGANDWLEYATNLMYSLFANTRFYPSALMGIFDMATYGTSFEMISDEVIDNQKIIYDCYSPFECYIDEGPERNVDTFLRKYSMTAEKAYAKWGDKLPDEVKDLAKGPGAGTEINFLHAIFPRKKGDFIENTVPAATSKRFASVHYCYSGDEVFSVSGYDEFPLAVHRCRLVGGSPYGVGFVEDNLPAILTLEENKRQLDIAIQRQTTPTLYAPESLRGRFDYRPGAINYGDISKGKPEPVITQLNIQHLANEVSAQEQQIQRLLCADLFNILMRQERQRTAYEVQELKGEGLVLLSAIIGNMQEEKLSPLVIRTFKIMMRNGMLPPAPEELIKASSEGRVSVELDGPLAQTMKAYHQTTGLSQGLQAIAAGAQIFPNAIINFDGDEIMRQYATSLGLPQSCILEQADVQKIKVQMAKAQQEQARQQQILNESQVLKNLPADESGNGAAIAQAISGAR